MNRKRIWIENLVLINSIVQNRGGIIDDIYNCYTDEEGNTSISIDFSIPFDMDMEKEYQEKRLVKK
jgi:hypothetical protein